jgi:hypothetical protein
MRCLPIAVLALALTGCNAQQKAQDVYNVIEAVVAVAQAEAVNVPAADQVAYNGFVTLAGTLADQLKVCITSSGTKSAKLLACFNAYAVGLSSPTELSQLRVLSPAAQKKVQLYVTSLVVGVNVALRFYGGSQVAAPAVVPTPTKADVDQLRNEIASRTGLPL